MKGKWMILVLVALLCVPGWADAVSEDNFDLDTTADLVELCTAPSSDPLQREAVGFCVGFLVGAYHYHVAENAGPAGTPMVCLPDPPPSRSKVAKMFIDWVKKHPEYMDDEAVETWARFLVETYPCKP